RLPPRHGRRRAHAHHPPSRPARHDRSHRPAPRRRRRQHQRDAPGAIRAARRRPDDPVGGRRRPAGARTGDPRRRGCPRPVDDPAGPAPMSPEDAPAGDLAGTDGLPLIPPGLNAVLAFVRHGESEFVAQGRFQGQADSPLTEQGRRQALLVARRIGRRTRRPALPLPAGPPHTIIHSPLARAAETAAMIGRAVSGGRGDAALSAPVSVVPEPGLLEIGQGEWEGLPGTEVTERWGEVLELWRREPLLAWAPGGEALVDVDARVRPALRQLLAGLAIVAPTASASRSQGLGYAHMPAHAPW